MDIPADTLRYMGIPRYLHHKVGHSQQYKLDRGYNCKRKLDTQFRSYQYIAVYLYLPHLHSTHSTSSHSYGNLDYRDCDKGTT